MNHIVMDSDWLKYYGCVRRLIGNCNSPVNIETLPEVYDMSTIG